MKGYKPDFRCKRQIEIFNKQDSTFLELGEINTYKCDCKENECKIEGEDD